MTAPTESALVVTVPAAEPVVGRWRRTLDRAAAWGVPAHVTVVYPFVPPDRLDDGVLAGVRAAVGGVPGFDCVFGAVRWFGADVVWLAPEPDEPFRALTAAVWRRFPEAPPYGGEFADPIPHLTIGHVDPPALRRAAAAVAPELPVVARVEAVTLLVGTDAPGSWHPAATFPLA